MKYLRLLLYILCLFIFSSHLHAYNFLNYSINEGLSHKTVNCIHKDTDGFIWIGTTNGLNRFDGYNFTVFSPQQINNSLFGANIIYKIAEFSDEKLWLATNNGIMFFDKKTETFFSVPLQGQESHSTSISIDTSGTVWACNMSSYIIKITKQKNSYSAEKIYLPLPSELASSLTIWQVEYFDGYVWVCTSQGIIRYNQYSYTILFVKQNSNQPFCASIRIGKAQELIITAPNRGICIVNTKSIQCKWIENTELLPKHKKVVYLFDAVRSDDGALYIAAAPGVFRYINNKSEMVTGNSETAFQFTQSSASALLVDNYNSLWVGTVTRGLFFVDAREPMFAVNTGLYQSNRTIPSAMCITVFENKSVLYGNSQGLFMSKDNTEYSLILENPITNIQAINEHECLVFSTNALYQYNSKTAQLLKIHDFWYSFCALQDNKGIVWNGYWGQGLEGTNFKTGEKYFISIDSLDQSKNIVYTIIHDADGSLWLGMYGSGLVHVQNPGSKHPIITKYMHNPNKNSISHNEILSLHDDKKGSLWIGTCGGGLNKFNKETQTFEVFTKQNGLQSNVIEAITSDLDGNIWFTSNVVSKYDIQNHTFSHFSKSDGVFGGFNVNSCCTAPNGNIYFGGVQGILSFDPKQIRNKTKPKTPLFTDFRLFGLKISPGDTLDKYIPYKTTITYTKHIQLPYALNSFSIEFSSLDIFENQNIVYAYMLEGVDRTWISTNNLQRIAGYSGLQPGSYVFHVKANNGSHLWSNVQSIQIEITPPWWATWWFRISITLIILGSSFAGIYYRIKKMNEQKKKLEHIVAERTQHLQSANQSLQENQFVIEIKNAQLIEALSLKEKLITVIAHDFKNPLTTLQGYASLLQNEQTVSKIKKYTKGILLSIQTLTEQMGSVLTWAQSHIKEVQYKPIEVNLELLIDDAISLIQHSAEQKNISIFTDYNFTSHAYIDPRMIHTVFRNILSNAVKFSHRNGIIKINVHEYETEINVSFIDSGLGMNAQTLQSIFCEQNDTETNKTTEKSSGLGLQICKAFIEKNQGKISVESSPNKGSIFSISLPKGKEKAIIRKQQNTHEHTDVKPTKHATKDTKQTILIVDNSEETRELLKESLYGFFSVIETHDGQIGLQHAQKLLPDAIICDTHLPSLEGFELCTILKSNTLTNHIPIIMTSAETKYDIQTECYACGADSFIQKPYDPYIVKHNIVAILENRKNYETFVRSHKLSSNSFTMPESIEDKVIRTIIEMVHKNFNRADFDINSIAEQQGLSRVQLWRKFKHTTGKNLSDYIRDLRMHKAAEMLSTKKYRISEIAYEVGFSDPKYFTKCFIKEFGLTPRAYADRISKK